MKFNTGVDRLVLFLGLSIVLIITIDSGVLSYSDNENSDLLKSTREAENLLSYPKCGPFSDNNTIFTFNENHKILISLDGGDTYFEYDNQVILSELENDNIICIPTSLHWRNSFDRLPTMKSILIKVSDAQNNFHTESRVLTYYSKFESELPVISMSIKNSDLYDEKKGIMIYGESGWTDTRAYESWWYRSANFAQRGQQWERSVNLQYFEDDSLRYEQNCGVRITGNATRYFPQKSLRLYSRRNYEDDYFEFPFWGNGSPEKTKSMILRNGGNDNLKTMFADLFVQNIAANTNVTCLKSKPVNLFINGNYWGIYFLQQRIDQCTLAENKGCSEKKITILDAPQGTLKDGSQKEAENYWKLIEEVSAHPSNPENEILMEENINMNSFIDYIIIETFIGNSDWPANNCTWYKEDGGKWEWIVYDSDVSMAYNGIDMVNENHLQHLYETNTITSKLYRAMLDSEKYKSRFFSRAEEMMNTTFSESNLKSEYLRSQELISNDMHWQISRWRTIRSLEVWQENCTNNLSFLLLRREVFINQLKMLQ